MHKAKIVELFKSIQGEGKYAGVQQVFVRFFGCNMHCSWCDTPHSIGDTTRRYAEYSLDEIWEEIKFHWDCCHSVSLTGGEPMLQTAFMRELLPRMKDAKMPAYLETNGIYYRELKEIIDDVDIIAMDIKLPSSTQCKPYWEEHKKFLEIAQQKDVFIKTVISNETTREDILRSVELVAGVNSNILFILQPNYFDMGRGVMDLCRDYQKACFDKLENVRIIPQVHKMLKVR